MQKPIALLLLMISSMVHAADWHVFAEPHGHVFPSLLIATASSDMADPESGILGDPNGYIGARIDLDAFEGKALELVVRAPPLLRESRYRIPASARSGTVEVYPPLAWDWQGLRANDAARPMSIAFELYSSGQLIDSQLLRVRLRGIHDAPYYLRHGEDNIDLSWMLAAYVDEDHPRVRELLGATLDRGLVKGFDGLQSGEDARVYAQVLALWDALRQRGLRYSSITRSAEEDTRIASQHVRFLDETLDERQANCVDAAVLFASALRKIDIAPSLVLLPEHALLAFALDAKGERLVFLETTMLTNRDMDRIDRPRSLSRIARELPRSSERERFVDAIAWGEAIFNEAEPHFGRDPRYRMINLQQVREAGIRPIPALARAATPDTADTQAEAKSETAASDALPAEPAPAPEPRPGRKARDERP